jgi:hypothetical protein
MAKRIIKLTESDLEKIVKRAIKEGEKYEGEYTEEEMMGDEGDSIMVSLDHIAMLLKDGECSCGGQKLVLDLEGGDDEEEEMSDYDDMD